MAFNPARVEPSLMTLHSMLEAAAGTSAVLLMMGGLGLVLRPRRLWRSWFGLEQRWRRARFGGGWTHLERSLRRRGYFWIPGDIELQSPEDVYAYALSERFWQSRYAWFVRALCWYAGLLLLFFGLLILGAGLPSLP